MVRRFVFAKKISLLTTLLLLLGSVWAFGVSGGASSPDNYSFILTDNGAVVTAYLGEGFADVVVPSTLSGQPVVAIDDGAFWGNVDIRSVQLPATVTVIGNNAFSDCTRLAQMSAVGVTTLGDYALYGCEGLTSITLSGDVAVVGRQALGSSRPTVSVEADRTIDNLLRVHSMLNEQGNVLLGSVGTVTITDELLALNSSLDLLLGNADTITIEGLWATNAIQVTNPDGSSTYMSFVELETELRSTGLYSILEPSKRIRLELRLDAMLEALLADAHRL